MSQRLRFGLSLLIICMIGGEEVLAQLPEARSSVSEYCGLPVRYLRAKCDGAFPREEVFRALVTTTDSLLTSEAVRNSIQNVYLLGLFSEINVDVEPFLDGVMVTYNLKRKVLIRTIRIDRSSKFLNKLFRFVHTVSNQEIYRVCNVRPFQELAVPNLDQGVESIKKLLREKGFHKSKVKYGYDVDATRFEATVKFSVDFGEPALIDSVSFEGASPLPVDYLKRVIVLREGRGYSDDVLKKDVQRLLATCRFYGFLDVRAKTPVVAYKQETNSVDLVFSITATQPVKINLDYPVHIWNWDWSFTYLEKNKTLDILGLTDIPVIAEDEFAGGAETLAETFYARGYPFAAVDKKIIPARSLVLPEQDQHREKLPARIRSLVENEDFRKTVVYTVEEGPLVKVASIEFPGITKLARTELESVVLTTRNKRFVLKTLLQDLTALKTLYHEAGYLDVAIGEPVITFSENLHQVFIIVKVTEGERSVISEVEFQGLSAFREGDLEHLLIINENEPVSDAAIDATVKGLEQFYRDAGFRSVAVTPNLAPTTEPHQHKLIMKVIEGRQEFFGKVIYRGYFKTQRKILDRQNQVLEGDPYRYDSLLESTRNISRLGLFSNVRFNPVPWSNETDRRTVVLSVTEKNTTFFEFGFGYNTDEGLKGFLDAYTVNLGGYNRTIGVSLLANEKERKFQISFKEPYFANNPITFLGRVYRHDSLKPDLEIRKDGAAINWEKKLSSPLSGLFGLRVESQDVTIHDLERTIDPRDRISIRVVAFGPSLLYDTRDDPRDPHKGLLGALLVEYAPRVLGSDVSFPRSTGQVAQFIALGAKTTLGLSLRYGIGYRLPITESFFIGGMKSVRGYDYESIHPADDDEGNPKPGNVMLTANAEVRYPLLWGFQGVIFVDAGEVWRKVRDVEIEDFRTSAGLGLRISTPLGPIGVDYGFKLDPEPGESAGQAEFTIGHAF